MGRKLPEGWEKKTLGELLEVQNGYAFKSTGYNNINGKPLIRIRDLKTNNPETLFNGNYDEKFLVKKGDLLIGMDGEFICYKWNGPDSLLNQRVCRLQNFKADFSSELIYYGINSYLKKIEDNTPFTTVKHISSSQIENINFAFPKLPTEQQKIVDYLNKQFQFIDNMESEINTYKDKLDVLEKGILEEAFSGFEENKIELGNLFDITSSKRIYESDYVTSGIPFYRSKEIIEKSQNKPTNINLFISNEKFEEIKSKYGAPKKGDILITAVGTIGIPYIVQDEVFYFKDGNLLWLKNQGKIEQKYLIYFLKSSFFRKFIDDKKGGAVYSALTIENLKNFEIYYPELNIQKSIAYKLDKQFELINSTKQEIIKQQENLKELRKAMLNDIFGGFEE